MNLLVSEIFKTDLRSFCYTFIKIYLYHLHSYSTALFRNPLRLSLHLNVGQAGHPPPRADLPDDGGDVESLSVSKADLWFSQDNEYMFPKTCINIKMESPIAYSPMLHANLTSTFAMPFKDELKDHMNAAKLLLNVGQGCHQESREEDTPDDGADSDSSPSPLSSMTSLCLLNTGLKGLYILFYKRRVTERKSKVGKEIPMLMQSQLK